MLARQYNASRAVPVVWSCSCCGCIGTVSAVRGVVEVSRLLSSRAQHLQRVMDMTRALYGGFNTQAPGAEAFIGATESIDDEDDHSDDNDDDDHIQVDDNNDDDADTVDTAYDDADYDNDISGTDVTAESEVEALPDEDDDEYENRESRAMKDGGDGREIC
jgi:hypothetical protein